MSDVSLLAFVLAVIVGLMLAETRLSSRHEALLVARGATVPPGDIFRVMAVVYPMAFVLMGAEGLWRAGVPSPAMPNWFSSGVVMFLGAKALKYWAIRSLGDRWTFRVVVVPGAPLVSGGPYRYVNHPNYIAVVGELAGTAMMMRARVTGPVMLALFGLVLWARIRFENRVLEALRLRPSS